MGAERMEEFKDLLEEHFLAIDETKIANGKVKFIKELELLKLTERDILDCLTLYFIQIFWTADRKRTKEPLHASRDFALELYAKVFSDVADAVKEYHTKPIDFTMFLAGIIDDPLFESPQISETLNLIAKSDETVLITGETGTGKELHAKVIHYMSPRKEKKFIALNCAGLTDSLLESELFGHEKGAFTGADRVKKGFMDEVGDGTLFLDEIGDMSLPAQAKVLRVLQSGDYHSVGGTKKNMFTGRVIAATNRNLQADMKATPPKFRKDLFYRLNVLPIELPPFRALPEEARKTAIVNKLRHIIYSKSDNPVADKLSFFLYKPQGSLVVVPPAGEPKEVTDNPFISKEALQLLTNYSFPGNYRELDAVLRQAYIFSRFGKIEVPAVKDRLTESEKTGTPKAGETTANIDAPCLKDIVDYANRVKKDIVRKKLESVLGNGGTLKGVLRAEGITDDKGYQRIRKRIANIMAEKK
jgi:transcriptional regulator with AAA-type ATPase domain